MDTYPNSNTIWTVKLLSTSSIFGLVVNVILVYFNWHCCCSCCYSWQLNAYDHPFGALWQYAPTAMTLALHTYIWTNLTYTYTHDYIQYIFARYPTRRLLGNRALLLGRTFLANMSIRHHLSSAAASLHIHRQARTTEAPPQQQQQQRQQSQQRLSVSAFVWWQLG